MRNFHKLKSLDDWANLDQPIMADQFKPGVWPVGQQILRMLVRPKYRHHFYIPNCLRWLEYEIRRIANIDAKYTGIEHSWCYVTVRSGEPRKSTAEWHFDGPSMRADTIPERNYVWCNADPTQYRLGEIAFPDDFDPLIHNMNQFAAQATKDNQIHTIEPFFWYMFTPFVLHRRDPEAGLRTFVRVSFLDVEIRDETNTQNPKLHTEAYGRNPVENFRNKLIDYPVS